MKENQSTGALSVILKFVSLASVLFGFIAASSLSKEWNGYWSETNTTVFTLWATGGVLNGLFWWVMSEVAAVCHKYLGSDKPKTTDEINTAR